MRLPEALEARLETVAERLVPDGLAGAFPHLADPLWLLLLLAVPLLVLLHHRRPRAGALTYSRLPRGAPAGLWRLHLPFYLRLAAFVLVVLALARPQLGYRWEESLTEGIDIEVVLDVSGSMAAEDFAPENRLAVAKAVVRDFIAGRPGDRLGVVIFSGTALTKAPLTTDRAMLDRLVEGIRLASLPDGTAIGVALAKAAARLRDSPAESRVIVLVTDGVNNAGQVDPLSAAAICAGLGIRVYTIGVGTEGKVPVPIQGRDPRTGRTVVQRQMLENQLDEPLLEEIAQRTGGRYFRATDAESLVAIFAAVDALETTPLAVERHVRYQEVFAPLAWTAFACLLLPLALAGLRVTVEP